MQPINVANEPFTEKEVNECLLLGIGEHRCAFTFLPPPEKNNTIALHFSESYENMLDSAHWLSAAFCLFPLPDTRARLLQSGWGAHLLGPSSLAFQVSLAGFLSNDSEAPISIRGPGCNGRTPSVECAELYTND